MRTLLRRDLGRSLAALAPLDRLAAALPVACGPALAAHAEAVSYDDGVLTLRVSSRQWLEPLEHMRPVLRSDLARIARVPVTAIHFEQATPRSSPR